MPRGKITQRTKNCVALSAAFWSAVLDIDLGSETSEAVAHSLISSDIPFAVVSGNLNAHMPAVFFGVPSFSKPVQLEGLLSFLKTTPQT